MHVDVGCYGAWGIARDVERPKAAISELLRHPNVLGIKAFGKNSAGRIPNRFWSIVN